MSSPNYTLNISLQGLGFEKKICWIKSTSEKLPLRYCRLGHKIKKYEVLKYKNKIVFLEKKIESLEEISTQNGPPKKINKRIVKLIK